MKTYIIDYDKWQSSVLPWPSDEQLKKAISSKNERYFVNKDRYGYWYIQCENKPRDLLVYGIYWKEKK